MRTHCEIIVILDAVHVVIAHKYHSQEFRHIPKYEMSKPNHLPYECLTVSESLAFLSVMQCLFDKEGESLVEIGAAVAVPGGRTVHQQHAADDISDCGEPAEHCTRSHCGISNTCLQHDEAQCKQIDDTNLIISFWKISWSICFICKLKNRNDKFLKPVKAAEGTLLCTYGC